MKKYIKQIGVLGTGISLSHVFIFFDDNGIIISHVSGLRLLGTVSFVVVSISFISCVEKPVALGGV